MSDEQSDPPRPRYGEYAPGYAPPTQDATSDAAAATPPTTPPAPPWSGAPAPQQGAPAGAPPQYGQSQYPQQPGQQYGQPPYGSPVSAAPTARKRSTVDLVFTVILLVLGVIGTLLAVFYASVLSDRSLLDQVFTSYGGFHGKVGVQPAVMIISHVVLLVAAAGLSILALVKRRIAFWIPLVAGVVAAGVFWTCFVSVITSDPGLLSRVSGG